MTPPRHSAAGSRASELAFPSPLPATWESAESEVARRILIIADETGLMQNIRQNLELDGHQVVMEREGRNGVSVAQSFHPHLVITDLAMLEQPEPGLLRQLRRDHESVPVLVLASRSEEATRLEGFRLGVDDYLVRPVGTTELHRRIDALLQQPAAAPARAESVVRFGSIEIHPASRIVLRSGEPVMLRLKEFDLLLTLVARAGAVVSRVDLLREVWGYRNWVATRTVDTHVAELRRKLEDDPANPRHILTVRKIGYRLER
jgi:DNA-binding response OmpR family regulator